jgi:hypothetical protein
MRTEISERTSGSNHVDLRDARPDRGDDDGRQIVVQIGLASRRATR